MTELFIDGFPVSLSEDFEIDYYVYNPFFSKKGDYTYDIDISLKDKSNAKIYKHINRLHVGDRPTGRKAILISNSKVITSGTEIILSLDADNVKIQIASGNSELNYLSCGDKTIRDIDLGTIPGITPAIAAQTLDKNYPDSNFVCCPVIKEKGNYEISDFSPKTDVIYNQTNWDSRNGFSFVDGTTFVAQPFLLYYVDKICEAIGYKVSENVLMDNPIIRKLIIVNGLQTNQYNRILPNWKVDEFISEIEKSYNVIFVVNQLTRRIRILNVYSFYEKSEVTYIPQDKVKDSKERKYDQDDSLYIAYDNVSYKLPSSTWYKYQSIDDEILKKGTIVHFDTYDAIDTKPYRGYYIFHDKQTDLNFVERVEYSGSYTVLGLEIINQLKGVIDEDSNNKCELKIVPAEIYNNCYWFKSYDFGGSKYFTGLVGTAVPVVSNLVSSPTMNNIYEEIENGIKEDETNESNLFIAIYLGPSRYMYRYLYEGTVIPQPILEQVRYPQCAVFPFAIHRGYGLYRLASDEHTLAILGKYGRFQNMYNKNVKVNTKEELILNFISNSVLNPLNKYVVANRKLYCKLLHYKVRPEGISKEVEGTFYPM